MLFYNTLRHGMTCRDPGADHYEEQYRSGVLANLKRRAKSLGFVLQAVPSDVEVAVLRKPRGAPRAIVIQNAATRTR